MDLVQKRGSAVANKVYKTDVTKCQNYRGRKKASEGCGLGRVQCKGQWLKQLEGAKMGKYQKWF